MEEDRVSKRKVGRTLLINSESTGIEMLFEGIKSTHETSSGSKFVIFDSTSNASSAYNSLIEKGAKVKYSYYRVFFRLDNHDESLDYDTLKSQVCAKLTELIPEINILYFKFYTKNNKLIGSGDFTIDTKETLDTLLTLREVDTKPMKISFYRFRVKKNNYHSKLA